MISNKNSFIYFCLIFSLLLNASCIEMGEPITATEDFLKPDPTSTPVPATPTPVPVVGTGAITKLSVGSTHVCGVTSDAKVKCWGSNFFGQLGVSTLSVSTTNVAQVVQESLMGGDFSGVIDVAAGEVNSCAIKNDNKVYCWGKNSSGELGDGTNTDSNYPVEVSGISNALKIYAKGLWYQNSLDTTVLDKGYACALLSTGEIKCWGLNTYSQLGNGLTADSNIPVSVAGISTATDISLGNRHACALLADGKVKCWGDNNWGQLGTGDTTDSLVPTYVCNEGATLPCTSDHLSNVIQIAAAMDHTCALINDGTMKCWGSNFDGSFGRGNTTASALPVSPSLTGISQIAVGGNSYKTYPQSIHYGTTCALISGGVKCWGSSVFSGLGTGLYSDFSTSTTPSTVKMNGGATVLSGVTSLATGSSTSCVIKTDNKVYCWGMSSHGQAGIYQNGTGYPYSAGGALLIEGTEEGVAPSPTPTPTPTPSPTPSPTPTPTSTPTPTPTAGPTPTPGGPTPAVAFSEATSYGYENVSFKNIPVTLSAVGTDTITVDYTITGTATGSGTDYVLANGTLTYVVGVTSADIALTVINDYIHENNETIILTLSNVTGTAAMGAETVHTHTIIDDDLVTKLTLVSHHSRSGSGTLNTQKWNGESAAATMGSPGRTWADANGVTASTATWTWNPNSQILASAGRFESTSHVGSSAAGNAIVNDKVVDLFIDIINGSVSATTYNCIEGTFLGPSFGEHGCGGYNFGIDFINDSTLTYNVGGDPNVVNLSLGGDDVLGAGARDLSVAFGLYTIVQDDTASGGQLVLSNGIAQTSPYTIYMTFNVATADPIPTPTPAFNASVASSGVPSKLANGGWHTCALMSDTYVKCWGVEPGSMTVARPVTDGIISTSPVDWMSGASTYFGQATELSSGAAHSCALMYDGSVKCWGYNPHGQVGDGSATTSVTYPATVLNSLGGNLLNATGISSGGMLATTGLTYISTGHSCAVLFNGEIKCWGHNGGGKLGDGTTTSRNSAVAVASMSNATQVSAGSRHTCARLADSTVKCWGSNTYWQSGQLDDLTNVLSPTLIGDGLGGNLSGVYAVSSGYTSTCALLNDSTVKCWGTNDKGALGDESTTDSYVPVTVKDGMGNALTGVTQIASAGATFMYDWTANCALLYNGKVKCWGANIFGALGNGDMTGAPYDGYSNYPVLVSGIGTTESNRAIQISGNGATFCAVLADSSVKCWGWNGTGQGGATNSSWYTGANWTPATVTGF